MVYRAEIVGRDWIELEVIGNQPPAVRFHGCSQLQKQIENFRNAPWPWTPPHVQCHATALLREVIQKACKSWNPPHMNEERLCLCRNISPQRIKESIYCGAHSAEDIALRTTAGTGCGTCRPRTQELLTYLLEKEG